FIVMGYYEGETLGQRLKRGPISPAQAADIIRQTARGLAEAHSKGIIHRDVKPSNIMLTHQGVVKLLDFGLAKFLGGETITHTGSPIGTAAYMSPEQALGKPVDRRTDIWSLGAVLYVIFAGKPPFQRDNVPATLLAVAQDALPPLEAARPEF